MSRLRVAKDYVHSEITVARADIRRHAGAAPSEVQHQTSDGAASTLTLSWAAGSVRIRVQVRATNGHVLAAKGHACVSFTESQAERLNVPVIRVGQELGEAYRPRTTALRVLRNSIGANRAVAIANFCSEKRTCTVSGTMVVDLPTNSD